jgi:uncharacterized protein YkwD
VTRNTTRHTILTALAALGLATLAFAIYSITTAHSTIKQKPATAAARTTIFSRWEHHDPAVSHTCGSPAGTVAWKSNNVQQRTQHCTLHAHFSHDPFPPKPNPTATAIAIATATPAPATLQDYTLSLLDADRNRTGAPPLAMSPRQNACSLAHSVHMSTIGHLAHDQFPSDVCIPWSSVGENVCQNANPNPRAVLLWCEQAMFGEGPSGGHYKNIVNRAFHTVGIGIFTDSRGTTWLTEDFTN